MSKVVKSRKEYAMRLSHVEIDVVDASYNFRTLKLRALQEKANS